MFIAENGVDVLRGGFPFPSPPALRAPPALRCPWRRGCGTEGPGAALAVFALPGRGPPAPGSLQQDGRGVPVGGLASSVSTVLDVRQGGCRQGQGAGVATAGSHFLLFLLLRVLGLSSAQCDPPGTQGSQQAALGLKLLTSRGSRA